MAETKEKTEAEKHEEFEKAQEKSGVAVHLPRVPVDGKKSGK